MKLARYRASDCAHIGRRGAAVCINYAASSAEADAAVGEIAT